MKISVNVAPYDIYETCRGWYDSEECAMYAVAFRRSVTEGAMFDVNALLAEVEECIDMAPMDWIAALKAAAEWCRQTIVTKQQAREP